MGLAPSRMGLIMMATALLGGIVALLYGKARHYISVHVTFLICFGGAAAGLAVMALAPSLAVLLLGFAIYSFGNSWFVANTMTSLGGKVKNHQQSRAAGLVKAGHFLSTPIMVMIVAPYAEKWGAVRRALGRRADWQPTIATFDDADLDAKIAACLAYTSQLEGLYRTRPRLETALRRRARKLGGERLWRH